MPFQYLPHRNDQDIFRIMWEKSNNAGKGSNYPEVLGRTRVQLFFYCIFMCLAYLLYYAIAKHWFILLLFLLFRVSRMLYYACFSFSKYLECFVLPVFFRFLFVLSACLHWTSEYLAWKQLSLAKSPASPVFPTFWGHNTPVINSAIFCFVSIFACSHLNMFKKERCCGVVPSA